MKRSLFTVVIDWDGGTYIDQVRAATPELAIEAWCKRAPELKPIGANSWRLAAAIRRSLEGDPPTPLRGLVGAFCHVARYRRQPVLINLVQTDTNSPGF